MRYVQFVHGIELSGTVHRHMENVFSNPRNKKSFEIIIRNRHVEYGRGCRSA